MATTNGGGNVPPSPTTSAFSQQDQDAAVTHTKNTAALCKYTTGDIPPPLIGATLTRIFPFPSIDELTMHQPWEIKFT